MARLIALGLCLLLFAEASPCAAATADYQWSLPRGFPVPFVPADNPMSVAKVALGRRLFFEPKLSVTGAFGCGGCHSGFSFAGTWRDAKGATGEPSFARNGIGPDAMRVPTLRNVDLTAPYMHDGRLSTLDAVLDHYEHAPIGPGVHRFTLNAMERSELLAFLRSLTDPTFTAGFDGERTHPVSRR